MSGRRIAILVVLLLALCCVSGALGFLGYRYLITPAEAAAKPVIVIDSPRQGDQVTVGEVVQVFATGQDETGITHMELYVDGLHIHTQQSALSDGANPFPLAAPWRPETEGNHTIVVRGYNVAGEPGQASISVNAVQGPDFPTEMPAEGCEGVPLLPHEVQEGETLEGIAAEHEVTVENLLACNPGVADPLTPGQILYIPYVVSPEEEEAGAQPADGPELVEEGEDPGGEELPPPEAEPEPGELPPDPGPPPAEPPLEPVSPPPPTPIVLEFEALQLQVNEQFVAVYCNAELQGDMERVPLDPYDFLAPMGLPQDNYWDIGAELGGAHSVPLAVLPGETVDLFVHCEAFFPMDIVPINLGTVPRNHGEGDWHGNPIEAVSTDGGGLPEGGTGEFKLVYRICEGDCEDLPVPEVPTNLQLNWCPALQHYFSWTWDGTYPIEGFRLYRDGALLHELAEPTVRFMQVSDVDIQPPCEGSYGFTLTAYEGAWGVGAESDDSAPPETVWGAFICNRTARVRFDSLWTACMLHDCPAPNPTCSNCQVTTWYGTIYANGQVIERPAPACDPGGCDFGPPPWEPLPSWRGQPVPPFLDWPLPVAGPGGVLADNTVEVPLGPFDDLTIGISLMDWDQHSGDDFICEGAQTLDHTLIVAGHTGFVLCSGGDPPGDMARVDFTITDIF